MASRHSTGTGCADILACLTADTLGHRRLASVSGYTQDHRRAQERGLRADAAKRSRPNVVFHCPDVRHQAT